MEKLNFVRSFMASEMKTKKEFKKYINKPILIWRTPKKRRSKKIT
jgi:hypothetical protein